MAEQKRNRALKRVLISLALCGEMSCGPGEAEKQDQATQEDAKTEFDDGYKTAEEREYARAGARFAALLMTGDYSAAHAMGSNHLRSHITVEDLQEAEEGSQKKFGVPLGGIPYPTVLTDPQLLAGPDKQGTEENMLDMRLRKMSARRAVGDLSSSVPCDIRRASVQVRIERDPKSIPRFEEQTGLKVDHLTEEDQVLSFLTVVLVEEEAELRVAHFFHRWPDVWDE